MSNIIKEISFLPSTIETIDGAVFDWLKTKNIHTNTINGFSSVPIIWLTPERSFQVKYKKEYRDDEGTLIFPFISIERTELTKDMNFKGPVQAHIPIRQDYKGGTIPGFVEINQDKTSIFQNADSFKKKNNVVGPNQLNFKYKKKNPKIVYTIYTTALPVWVSAIYTIHIRTDFQQQMNEIIQPFLVEAGQITSFAVSADNHRFEAFYMNDFSIEDNKSSLGDDERKFETNFKIKVLGYLMGKDKNEENPKLTIRENAVDIKFLRERVSTQDSNENITQKLIDV